MDNNIGKKLDGRYELLELIGVGGMADIYRARDIQENRIVAVKILKTEFAGSDEFLRRFRNESKAIALLSHPNIVKIYDVGFTEKVQFIVMEYVDGITLTDYIEQQGVLKWRDAVHFTVQILRALQHAHDRGIVHRDVKSSNIMLLRDGTIKVMDFGIARFNRENNKTMSEKTIGSVHYISPEQARGDITDERSDIYSVGVMLYEMLTGKKPYDGDTPVAIALKHMQSTPQKPTELNSTIPEGLEQIVLRAMQKEPTARYQTAGEMITDLEEFKKNPGIVFDYKYNSTDGTAKFADKNPAVEQEKQRRKNTVVEDYDEDDDDDYDDDDEVEERRSPLIPILFAVGAAFVIATVFLVLMLLANGFGGKDNSDNSNQSNSGAISISEGGEFNMPNLVGMTWDEALATYGDGKLMKLVPTQEYNEAKEGFIFEQEFVEGRRVKQGVTVNVKVSMGIKQVEIQDVSGRTADNAEKTLKRDGFKVSKTFADSEDIAEGHVIKTTPEAHEFLPQGSTVVIVVSNGAADKMFYMPKLVGMPMEDATKRCDEYKLIPKLQPKDSDEEKGRIIEQSIKEGEKVAPNTEVILTYSTGEIPQKECEINITLPTNIKGEYEFKFFVDGELMDSKTLDVGLIGSKSLSYTVTGKPGEEKMFAIKVKSTKTGNDGYYLQVKVTFKEGDEKTVVDQIMKDSAIFNKLLKEDTSSSSSDEGSSDSETSLV